MEKNKENENEMPKVTFVSIKASDIIIFDDKEPIIVLTDILQPFVKVENCIWLEEL